MKYNLLTLLILCFCMSACHKKALVNSVESNDSITLSSNSTSEVKNVIIDKNFKIIDTSSTYTIDSTKIQMDLLSIFVSYSGGCKTHSFELYSNGAYAKSLPPQTSVYLKHENGGDACRQLIREELKFNIEQLKYTGQNKVIIHLGNNQRIIYKTQ